MNDSATYLTNFVKAFRNSELIRLSLYSDVLSQVDFDSGRSNVLSNYDKRAVHVLYKQIRNDMNIE